MAFSSIVLADAQATPVNHTFVPIGFDKNGIAWWEDQSAASSIGNWRISLQFIRAGNPAPGSNAGDRVNRVKVSLHEPILETLGTNDNGLLPPAQVAYIPRSLKEFVLPDRASSQNRKDLRKMSYNLENNSMIVAAVEDLVNVFA